MIWCLLILAGAGSAVTIYAANTTVDLTTLFSTDAGLSHTCSNFLVPEYDDSSHWNRCSECDKTYNKAVHSYTDAGWTMGSSNNCIEENVHTFVCSCGYSYSDTAGRKSHGTITYVPDGNSYYCIHKCNDCGGGAGSHKTKIGGKDAICSTNGTGRCDVCNTNYTKTHNPVNSSGYLGKYKCSNCNLELYELVEDTLTYVSDGVVKRKTVAKLSSGISGTYIGYWLNENTGFTNSTPVIATSGNTYTAEYTMTFNSKSSWYNGLTFVVDSTAEGRITLASRRLISPENVKPVVSSVTERDLATSDGWSTSKEITVKGTENYASTVTITVKDASGNILIDNATASVTSNSWAYVFNPDIEADANGKKISIIVTDEFGNSTIKEHTLYKIDKIAPSTSVKTTVETWSKTKDVTFSATDLGVGNVKVSFNDKASYYDMTKNGTSYSKAYTFTGDVYGSFVTYVYYKDALGNEARSRVTVYNLDNTAPTITEATATVGNQSSTITVTANDKNTTLNKEGSGVSEYGYSASNDSGKATWQTSNVITISKAGTYYVWAKDAVGNISTSQSVTVNIQYNLTIEPNGGTWSSTFSNTAKLNNGATLTLVGLTKTGYALNDWTVSGTGSSVSGNVFKMGTADATITANWTPITYEVQYNGNGSTSGSMTNSTHTYGTAKNLTANTFKKQYTVTFDANGGSCTTASGTAIATFSGWATSASGAVAYADKTSVSNLSSTKNATVTLYAKWSNAVLSSLPTPTRTGYAFKGWYTAKTGGTKISTSTNFANATTVYALWDKYPELEVNSRYFTLEQARNGKITEAELLKKVVGSDVEDGILTNGSKVRVKDYNAAIFKNMVADSEVEITYQATDSYGNTVTKKALIIVTDTTMRKGDKKYIRFIRKEFFSNERGSLISQNDGGLEEDSIWRINEVYRDTLWSTLYEENEELERWYLSAKDIGIVKDYTKSYGRLDEDMEDFISFLFSKKDK